MVSEKIDKSSLGLVRGLGAWAAVAVVVGSMVGQAVFLVTSDMARLLGSPKKVLAAWIVGGIVVLFGSSCFAELGAAIPEAGGAYLYLSRGLGPVWGFLFGWTSAMIMRPGSGAIIAAGLLRFAAFLLPSLNTPIFVWRIWVPFQFHSYQTTFAAAQLSAAAMIGVVTLINYFGVRTAGRFQIFLTSLKVTAAVGIVILGFTLKKVVEAPSASVVAAQYGGLGAFLTALVPAMAAYNGFSVLGEVGGEIENPRRNLPLATISGVLLVISLYVMINWIYFHVLGFLGVAQSEHVASDAMVQLLGARGAQWITLAMIVSAFGSLHVNLLGGPRVAYAMARDGVFFNFAKRIQPRFRTPSGAVIFQGSVAILLVLTGTYQELYSFAMFAIWIFFALTAVALIRLRNTEPDLARPYRAWGYPLTPLVFGVAALAISLNIWLVRPIRSSVGLLIILLGVPFYHFWRKRRPYSETGRGRDDHH